MRARLITTLLVFLTVTAGAQEHRTPTVVIIVRHAEKAAPSGDPPLNAAGMARAKELARVLADANVKAIFVTQYLRTRETAEPLATLLGIKPVVVKTTESYAKDVVKEIGARPGETLLVVTHSNTIGDVMRYLGIAPPPVIPDTEYDDLFVCTVGEGAARVVRLRYGAPAR